MQTEGKGRCSIIVSVFNEAKILPRSIAALLNGLPQDAELIFSCNGCTDDSVAVINRLAGDRVRILDLPKRGKTYAMREAERVARYFPRFFVDADIVFLGRDFPALIRALREPGTQIVSPRMVHDMTGCTWASRAINSTWRRLPIGKQGYIQCVIGISETGRRNWGELPDVMADDLYMLSHIKPSARNIVESVQQTSFPPRTFWNHVGVRSRFIKGNRKISEMGLAKAGNPTQKSALLKLLFNPMHTVPTVVYIIHRLLAERIARREIGHADGSWFTDSSTRS